MHTFRDTAGRTWTVAINVTAIARVRGTLGIDLNNLLFENFEKFIALFRDPVQLADMLYCLCKDEAEARNITKEEFGAALSGDALADAKNAFANEYIAFFDDPQFRNIVRKVVEAYKALTKEVMDTLETDFEQRHPQSAAKTSSTSFGTAPESSDWTPVLSDSGS
jgi:hypothetical protein